MFFKVDFKNLGKMRNKDMARETRINVRAEAPEERGEEMREQADHGKGPG